MWIQRTRGVPQGSVPQNSCTAGRRIIRKRKRCCFSSVRSMSASLTLLSQRCPLLVGAPLAGLFQDSSLRRRNDDRTTPISRVIH